MVIRALLTGIFVKHILNHMYTFSCRSGASADSPNCPRSFDVAIFLLILSLIFQVGMWKPGSGETVPETHTQVDIHSEARLWQHGNKRHRKLSLTKSQRLSGSEGLKSLDVPA